MKAKFFEALSPVVMTTIVIIGSVLMPKPQAKADVTPVTLSSEDEITAPRLIYGNTRAAPKANSKKKANAANDALSLELANVKSAQLEGDYENCLKRIDAVRAKAKLIQGWLSLTELDCAAHSKTSATAAGADKLAKAVVRVEANPDWLIKGPQVTLIKPALVQAYLDLIEQDAKTNRVRAWKSIESAQDLLPYMDTKARAKLWRMAGDLAFAQQKIDAARDLMRRSLSEENNEELRARLNAIGSGDSKEAAKIETKSNKYGAPATGSEASRDELDLVDRITASMKSGELVAAVEDAIKLITNYPGSTRAKWATDRVLDAYLSLIDKSDAKYILVRERILKLMQKADADRLADWSRTMYSKGQYSESYDTAHKALETLTGAKRAGVLDLAAKAALASDHFAEARNMSAELTAKYAGTKESHEALFRIGLLNYRLGELSEAQTSFEKILSINQSDNLELPARYWLWRVLQKNKTDTSTAQAEAAADELTKRFPFSYYGLRARYERTQNTLEWKSDVQKVESQVWLTATERRAWDRLQLLLKSGWLEEAQAELKTLPPPLKADDKAVRALLWAAAGQYLTASKLANDAWDEKGELRSMPFVAAAFPSEFDTWITEQSKARNLDRFVVKGLIKQESGYNARAVSPSNALGLMQMIPPTAKEIANDLKMPALDIPSDLFIPKKNIQLGTYYFSKLLNKYQGVVPLALAAYNAGPGRMDRWLRARPSLKGVISTKSSAPDDEIWFDEIPYAETSFYVKAILRNDLIYKMLDQGRVTVKDPLWEN